MRRSALLVSIILSQLVAGACDDEPSVEGYQCDALFVCTEGSVFSTPEFVNCPAGDCDELCLENVFSVGVCAGGCFEEGSIGESSAICLLEEGMGGAQNLPDEEAQEPELLLCSSAFFCINSQVLRGPDGIFCGNGGCEPNDCYTAAKVVATCTSGCASDEVASSPEELCLETGLGGAGGAPRP
ncbi:MAG: hypothetical protein MK135_06900 [Polyangiaceae bacterium]|nr:hypothetical protein [Polyangiaceae bacterium]